jgi:ABC-2 type transport system permease protein
MSFARDTLLIFRRQMRLSLRNPAWVIIGLVQPILYLVFFGPLLTQVARGGLPASRPATPTASSCPAC